MIYKFMCKVAGDLTVLGPTGDQMLSIIGKAPAEASHPAGFMKIC